MTANDYQQIQVAPNFTPANVMREVEERGGYALGADDITTIDLPFALYVLKDRIIFELDPDDVTSVHDGVSVLVSNDGKRFKSDVVGTRLDAVLDRIADPPGLPNSGDAYIITSPATGDWAGREDDIALFSLNGWLFVTPAVGFAIFVRDELGFYHVLPNGTWTSGLGAFQSTDGSLSIAALDIPFGLAVEAEQNDPPAMPVDGSAYIVGSAPTGAWVGENQNIALRRSGLWVFVAKYHGASVYDRSLDLPRKFDGLIWTDLVAPAAAVAYRAAQGSLQVVINPLTVLWNFVSVPALLTDLPEQSEGEELLTIQHAGLSAANRLQIPWYVKWGDETQLGNVTNSIRWVAVFIDAETTPRELWHGLWTNANDNRDLPTFGVFEIPVIDTAQHTYRLIAGLGGTTASQNPLQDIEEYRFSLTEMVPSS